LSKVYKYQNALRIELTTGVDITGATVKKIKYKKPSETEGYWNAQVSSATNGVIYYDVISTEIDESGTWTFWAYITFEDGRSAPGEVVKHKFFVEGEN